MSSRLQPGFSSGEPLPQPSRGEHSEIRARDGGRERSPELEAPSAAHDALQRAARIERKLRMSKAFEEKLPPGDARARLLRAAIVRRDEVLLDGVLSMLMDSGKR